MIEDFNMVREEKERRGKINVYQSKREIKRFNKFIEGL